MRPKLIGNPLVAWRDDHTLQIGWGEHGVVVESAPPKLPEWLARLSGDKPTAELLHGAEELGVGRAEASQLLRQMHDVGLLERASPVSVSIAGNGVIRDPLGRALRDAGLRVDSASDVVVFPQGQLPCLTGAPASRRLIPVWFGGHAVHVGPVVDRDAGPCRTCVDLTWVDYDPLWPRLVAQSTSLGLWGSSAQILQAAAAIVTLCRSPSTIGLEMIIDESKPGPCWRVWSVHPRCDCHQKD